MDEAQDGQELIELSDLDVETVGLVYRGAVRKPFFFIKSEDGGVEVADEQERVEEHAQPAEGLTEEAFTERLEAMRAKIAEEFTAKLESESEARQKAEEAFAAEKKLRELAEFTDQAQKYSFSVGEVEQFAEDLWQLRQHDAELYERFAQRFRALDEQVRQGELFAQKTRAGDGGEGSEFERTVERIRVERFGDMETNAGFVAAWKVVEEEKPELAARFARGEA